MYVKVRDLKEALVGVDDDLYVAMEENSRDRLVVSTHKVGVEEIPAEKLGAGFVPRADSYKMFVLG